MKLSLIIPIGFKEKQLKYLLKDLEELPNNSEVLLITSDLDDLIGFDIKDYRLNIRTILSPLGRANSMNLGAKEAQGEFLWFLHADSKLEMDTMTYLLKALHEKSKHLLYFNLAFYDGPKLMKITEWGVRFRTYFLKTPFGDQGFCIRKDIFNQLGRYKTDVSYGEDHLLVREARRIKVPITRIKTKIYTSARKYEKNGWIKTTTTHLYLWLKQVYEDYENNRRNKI